MSNAVLQHVSEVQPQEGPDLPEPIAVIGLACRLPGAVNARAYWRLLKQGEDAIREVPADRWNVNQFHSEDPAAEGRMVARHGGFLEGLDLFDNQFFNISPKEAMRLDPQQRLMLEIAWESFEDAGLPPGKLAGSRTAVFVGAMGSEYDWVQARDMRLVNAYSPTGSAQCLIANRLSYFFDLNGPSVSLDSACSSSLVAVSMACKSLWAKDCEMALAGGVTVILSPGPSIGMSKLSALSPDGRCKTFDAKANGYVRSEGAGAVVLKPLSKALADKDRIYGIIRSCAINNDGKTNGLTAPSRAAQERLLVDAYAQAGMDPRSVQYVEAHGTGTLLGDPIEAAALGAVVGAGRESPCLIGSVKTNVGHLEGAAGVAALIKVCLMLEKQEIPRSLHFETPNPYIPFQQLGLEVVTAHQPWVSQGPRRAGVSAFGFGGTNCHVVLEQAPARQERSAQAPENRAQLLVISGKSPAALLAQLPRYEKLLTLEGAPGLEAACRTAALRHAHHDHRAFVVASDAASMGERLAQLRREERSPQAGIERSKRGRLKLAFVFPGLGPQWQGMAQSLLSTEPVFREAVETVDLHVRALAGWSVLDELEGEHSGQGLRDAHIEKIQTTLFALQVGLAHLWRSWGVNPDAVVGHSMGEVAAAVVAQVLSLEEAVRLMVERSRLLHASSGKGAMAAVELGLTESLALLQGQEERLSVAASNSPESTVLSGDSAALDAVLQTLERQGVAFRAVRTTGVAGHGPQLEEARHTLTQTLKGALSPKRAQVSFYSTKAGTQTPGEALDARYWGDQLREPVLFSKAIEQMHEEGLTLFLELSPHPVLAEDVRRCFARKGAEAWVLPSLRRHEDERSILLGTLGRLHALGRPVKLEALFSLHTAPISLPAYPWQRERFWLDPDESTESQGSVSALSQVRDEALLTQIQNDRWLYQARWEPSPRASLSTPLGPWLLVCDDPSAGEHLAQQLRHRGQHCTVLSQVLSTLPLEGPEPFRGVVHLTSLPVSETWPSLLALLHLLQDRPLPTQLFIVTRGAHALGGSGTDPQHALLWGMGRSAANELPSLNPTLVDVDPALSAEAWTSSLVEELLAPSEENQVALRGEGQRFVSRLVPLSRTVPSKPVEWRKDAAYVITGGLGALGLRVAQHLALKGARRLLLFGRSSIPARSSWASLTPQDAQHETVQALLALERLGADVRVESLDVSDRGALEAFLLQYRQEARAPIAGVVHCAGIVRDQQVAQLEAKTFSEVLRPKLDGAWNLHHALMPEALDFFVLFSSAAGLLGSPGQAAYAAANATLDALAEHRRTLGLPGLSLAWGPWSEVGLAHRPDRGGRLALRGLRSFLPEAGMAVFERLLGRETPATVAILDAQWEEFFRSYGELAERPFYASVRAQIPGAPVSAALSLDVSVLKQQSPAEQQAAVKGVLLTLLGRAVGTPPERLDPLKPLNQWGLDSLMVMELSHRLKRALGVQPDLEFFTRESSTEELALHLLSKLGLRPDPVQQAPARNEWIYRPSPRPQATARVLCFGYAGAGPWTFQGLAKALPPSIELCSIQIPGRGTRLGEAAPSDWASLEAPTLEAIQGLLDKPFVLFGYSLGGLLAFEVCRSLRRRGLPAPRALVVAAARAPHLPPPFPSLIEMDDPTFIAQLRRFGGTPEEALRNEALMAQVVPVLRADFALISGYRHQDEAPLSLPVKVFGGAADTVLHKDELAAWSRHGSPFSLRFFEREGHFFLKSREDEWVQALTLAVND